MKTHCMVDLAKFFLEFTVDESCGKCPPCRIGTKRMLEIRREGSPKAEDEPEDLDKAGDSWQRTSKLLRSAVLGQTAPNPVLSAR